MKKIQKKFDAVAFMRKRREELSRAYTGLSTEQIKAQLQKSLKDDPLWTKGAERRARVASRKKRGASH